MKDRLSKMIIQGISSLAGYLSFKRLTAITTVFCFLFSFVFSQSLYAVVEQQKGLRDFGALLNEFVIPSSVGRITDGKYFGGKQTVINIQDLHCHPEVQRNIGKILGILDERYKLKKIYVEGASGAIDTSWLSDIKDKELKKDIVESLLEKGKLTGTEHYSIISGRADILCGVEDENLYKANLLRLNKILGNKERYEREIARLRKELFLMEERYFNAKNKRFEKFVEKYRRGDLDAEKYYKYLRKYSEKINSKNNPGNLRKVVFNTYRNTAAYLELLEWGKRLKYKTIARQLQALMVTLKQRLPYSAYNSLLTRTDNFQKLDDLYVCLSKIVREYKLDMTGEYPQLNDFFNYIEKGQKINPLKMIEEEKRLVEEIRTGLSEDFSELEVSFLVDFQVYFENYLYNKLSADDYEYFKRHFQQIKLLWAKYSDTRALKDLEEDFVLLDDYYQANVDRNNSFIHNISRIEPAKETSTPCGETGDMAKAAGSLDSADEVIVVVTGGFHTEGLSRLLNDRRISYLTITPNVTKDTKLSDVVYEVLAKQQAKILQATLAPMLASMLIKLAARPAAGKEQAQAIAAVLDYVLNAVVSGQETKDIKTRISRILSEGSIKKYLGNEAVNLTVTEGNDSKPWRFVCRAAGETLVFEYKAGGEVRLAGSGEAEPATHATESQTTKEIVAPAVSALEAVSLATLWMPLLALNGDTGAALEALNKAVNGGDTYWESTPAWIRELIIQHNLRQELLREDRNELIRILLAMPGMTSIIASIGVRVSHNAVNAVIGEYVRGLGEGGLKAITESLEQGGMRANAVPIKGLYEKTGQFGHIGLGRANGVPTAYIDSALQGEDRRRVLSHELYEISQWKTHEAVLRDGGYGGTLRDWILENIQEAKFLAEKWHKESPAIDDIFDRYHIKNPDTLVSNILAGADENDVNLAAGISLQDINAKSNDLTSQAFGLAFMTGLGSTLVFAGIISWFFMQNPLVRMALQPYEEQTNTTEINRIGPNEDGKAALNQELVNYTMEFHDFNGLITRFAGSLWVGNSSIDTEHIIDLSKLYRGEISAAQEFVNEPRGLEAMAKIAEIRQQFIEEISALKSAMNEQGLPNLKDKYKDTINLDMLNDTADELLSILSRDIVVAPMNLADTLQWITEKRTDKNKYDIKFVNKLSGAGSAINGNKHALKRVIDNFVRNSERAFGEYEALRREDRRITITLEMKDGEYVVTYADNGPGIPAGIKERIFEPGVTSKENSPLSGYGMAICKDMVTRLGGRISVESEPGKGATFTIALPAIKEAGANNKLPWDKLKDIGDRLHGINNQLRQGLINYGTLRVREELSALQKQFDTLRPYEDQLVKEYGAIDNYYKTIYKDIADGLRDHAAANEIEYKVMQAAAKSNRPYLDISNFSDNVNFGDVSPDLIGHVTNYEALLKIIFGGNGVLVPSAYYGVFFDASGGQTGRIRINKKPGVVSLVFNRKELAQNGIRFQPVGEIEAIDPVPLKYLTRKSKRHVVDVLLNISDAWVDIGGATLDLTKDSRAKIAHALGYGTWYEMTSDIGESQYADTAGAGISKTGGSVKLKSIAGALLLGVFGYVSQARAEEVVNYATLSTFQQIWMSLIAHAPPASMLLPAVAVIAAIAIAAASPLTIFRKSVTQAPEVLRPEAKQVSAPETNRIVSDGTLTPASGRLTDSIDNLVAGLEKGQESKQSSEKIALLKFIKSSVETAPEKFERFISAISNRRLSINDLSEKIEVEYLKSGTNKKLYLVKLRDNDDREIRLVFVTKTEMQKDSIKQSEINDMRRLSAVPGIENKLVPIFGEATQRGEVSFSEEFIEGRTLNELDASGSLTEGIKRKAVRTLFMIGLLLGGAFPEDINKNNFIYSDGTERKDVVMVDIGHNRVSLPRVANNPNMPLLSYLLNVSLTFSKPGENAFIIDELSGAYSTIKDLLERNKIVLVNDSKEIKLEQIKKYIDDSLANLLRNIKDDAKKSIFIEKSLNNFYIAKSLEENYPGQDKRAALLAHLDALENSIRRNVNKGGGVVSPSGVVLDEMAGVPLDSVRVEGAAGERTAGVLPEAPQQSRGGRWPFLRAFFDWTEKTVAKYFGVKAGWIAGQVLMPALLESALFVGAGTVLTASLLGIPFILGPPLYIILAGFQLAWHLQHGKTAFSSEKLGISGITATMLYTLQFVDPTGLFSIPAVVFSMVLPHLVMNYQVTHVEGSSAGAQRNPSRHLRSTMLLTLSTVLYIFIGSGFQPMVLIAALFPTKVFFSNVSAMSDPGFERLRSGKDINTATYRNVRLNENIPELENPKKEGTGDPYSMTVMIPVYTEDFNVIRKTIESALREMENYGPKANLVIADDGLMVFANNGNLKEIEENLRNKKNLTVEENELLVRLAYYRKLEAFGSEGKIRFAVVARPKYDKENPATERKGKFKKAGNLDFVHRYFDLIRNGAMKREDALNKLLNGKGDLAFVLGDVFVGENILLLDKDSIVPEGIGREVVSEFVKDPNLSYVQCAVNPSNKEESYFTNIVSYLTEVQYGVLTPLAAVGGAMVPLVGHNAFIRTAHLQQNGYWPENRVSEDYSLAIDLNAKGYHGKYVDIRELRFGEMVPSNHETEAGKRIRYAYGAVELMFNPVKDWYQQGIFTEQYKNFTKSSDVPRFVKADLTIYLTSYISYMLFMPFIVLSSLFPIFYGTVLVSFLLFGLTGMAVASVFLGNLFNIKSLKRQVGLSMLITGIMPDLAVGVIQYLFSAKSGYSATSVGGLEQKPLSQVVREMMPTVKRVFFFSAVFIFGVFGGVVFEGIHQSELIFSYYVFGNMILAPFIMNPEFSYALKRGVNGFIGRLGKIMLSFSDAKEPAGVSRRGLAFSADRAHVGRRIGQGGFITLQLLPLYWVLALGIRLRNIVQQFNNPFVGISSGVREASLAVSKLLFSDKERARFLEENGGRFRAGSKIVVGDEALAGAQGEHIGVRLIGADERRALRGKLGKVRKVYVPFDGKPNGELLQVWGGKDGAGRVVLYLEPLMHKGASEAAQKELLAFGAFEALKDIYGYEGTQGDRRAAEKWKMGYPGAVVTDPETFNTVTRNQSHKHFSDMGTVFVVRYKDKAGLAGWAAGQADLLISGEIDGKNEETIRAFGNATRQKKAEREAKGYGLVTSAGADFIRQAGAETIIKIMSALGGRLRVTGLTSDNETREIVKSMQGIEVLGSYKVKTLAGTASAVKKSLTGTNALSGMEIDFSELEGVAAEDVRGVLSDIRGGCPAEAFMTVILPKSLKEQGKLICSALGMKVVEEKVIEEGSKETEIKGREGENVKIIMKDGAKLTAITRIDAETVEIAVTDLEKGAEKLFGHMGISEIGLLQAIASLKGLLEENSSTAYATALKYEEKDIPGAAVWEKIARPLDGELKAAVVAGNVNAAVAARADLNALFDAVGNLLSDHDVKDTVVGIKLAKLWREGDGRDKAAQRKSAAKLVMFMAGVGERVLRKAYFEEKKDGAVAGEKREKDIGKWLLRAGFAAESIGAAETTDALLDKVGLMVAMGRTGEARQGLDKLRARLNELNAGALFKYVAYAGMLYYATEGTRKTVDGNDVLLGTDVQNILLSVKQTGENEKLDYYVALWWMAKFTNDSAFNSKAEKLYSENALLNRIENGNIGAYARFLHFELAQLAGSKDIQERARNVRSLLESRQGPEAIAARLIILDILNTRDKLSIINPTVRDAFRSVEAMLGAG